MGVAGSDQGSGSEHPGQPCQPSRDVAGAADSPGLGAVPRVSIGTLRRSPCGCGRLTPVGAHGADARPLD